MKLTIIGTFVSIGSGNPETSGFKGVADVKDRSLILLAVGKKTRSAPQL